MANDDEARLNGNIKWANLNGNVKQKKILNGSINKIKLSLINRATF